MGNRRYSKTLYLRVEPAKHEAVRAYAARRSMTLSAVLEHLVDELLRHEVLAAPRLRRLEERVEALESVRAQ